MPLNIVYRRQNFCLGLTAGVLCPPAELNAFAVALRDVGGNSRAHTLAVPSSVAATRVPYTGVVVVLHGNL